MHHRLVVVFSSPVWPVRLQPRLRNVLSLQYQTLKTSNRCFWTGAEPKPSHMRSICPDFLCACELLPCVASCTHTHSSAPPHHNIPLKPTPASPSWLVTGGGHPELLLQLEGRHCLLCLGAPLLPGRLRVLRPEPQQAQGELPAGLQHRRVSAHPFARGSRWILSAEAV